MLTRALYRELWRLRAALCIFQTNNRELKATCYMKRGRAGLSHNTALSLCCVSPNQLSGPKTEAFAVRSAEQEHTECTCPIGSQGRVHSRGLPVRDPAAPLQKEGNEGGHEQSLSEGRDGNATRHRGCSRAGRLTQGLAPRSQTHGFGITQKCGNSLSPRSSPH